MVLRRILRKDRNDNKRSEAEVIQSAKIALIGTGQYASMSMSDNWQEGERKMQLELEEFEAYAEKYSSATLYALTGFNTSY